MIKILNLETNLQGRDFIIGDLHGTYQLFLNLLRDVKFDTQKDRVISVGDLVDRGTESLQCLELLDEPWFFATKANHEDMFLNWLNPKMGTPGYGNFFIRNGGNWAQQANFDALQREEIALKLDGLPNIINVSEFTHVIHAELYHQEPLLDQDFLTNNWQIQEAYLFPSNDGSAGLWGRFEWGNSYVQLAQPEDCPNWQSQLKGLVFSGHTPQQQATKLNRLINLDTLAYGWKQRAWAGLSSYQLDTNQLRLTRETTEKKTLYIPS